MARLYMSIFTALIMLFLTLASGIGLLVFGKQFPYKGFYAATAEISVRLLAAIVGRHAEHVKPSEHSLLSGRPEYNEV